MKVLVTGAAGGIGGAVVKKFIESGDEVYGIARNTGALPVGCLPLYADLQSPTDLEGIVRYFSSGVDVVVHAAGILRTDGDPLQEQRRINFVVPVTLTQRLPAHNVIFLNSVAALLANPRPALRLYAASKLNLRVFAKSHENRSYARIASIYLGRVATPMLRKLYEVENRNYDVGKLSPEDVAEAVRYLADLPPHIQVPELHLLARETA
jgi:NADP-dependent 3-hydroxy acid dehydrogenase YdfG